MFTQRPNFGGLAWTPAPIAMGKDTLRKSRKTRIHQIKLYPMESAVQNQLDSELAAMPIIVAGITRSGLTLVTSMLQAAGFDCAGGKWPFEPYPMGEIPWEQMSGKVVKVVDTQNQIPPKQFGPYRVILMKRNFKQQTKSIEKFLRYFKVPLVKWGRGSAIEKSLEKDFEKILSWTKRQPLHLLMTFEQLISEPEKTAMAIHQFVTQKHILDVDLVSVEKMAALVVGRRSSDCYPTMLEIELQKTIEQREIEALGLGHGKRVWHFAFGWGKVIDIDFANGKTLVDLEADSISYYHMGEGYKTYTRNSEGNHYFTAPSGEFFDSEKPSSEWPGTLSLKHAALNPKITFNQK